MKLGIIGAMDVEVSTLKEKMEQVTTATHAGSVYWEGMLEGTPAVVVQCGVGKVNAALCAQILISVYGVTQIVNTGIAGSLCADLDICDLVISRDAIYHDFDLRFWGRPIGQVPGMDVVAFPADETMISYALAAAEAVNPGHSKLGRVATGDQFINSGDVRSRIHGQFRAKAVEMEGGAVAQACYMHGVPCGVLRSISDQADGQSDMDYPTFTRLAAAHSQQVVQKLLVR